MDCRGDGAQSCYFFLYFRISVQPKAVTCSRRIVAVLSPLNPGCDPRPVYVGYEALGQGFLALLQFFPGWKKLWTGYRSVGPRYVASVLFQACVVNCGPPCLVQNKFRNGLENSCTLRFPCSIMQAYLLFMSFYGRKICA